MSLTQPDGYLATPPSGDGSGVLVLHAWWGLNDTMKDVCNRLAGAGFDAFAPDLYHGRLADNVADAEALAKPLFAKMDQPRADVAAAATFLNEHTAHDGRGLAVIGFSLGAFFALDLSVTAPEHVHSAVVYYGTRPGDYSKSRAAYLGHFAAADDFEPQSEVDNLEEALKRAGRPATFHRYPDTGHWFCEPDRIEAYNQEAAEIAWERTLAFLKRPAAANQ